MPDVLGDLYEGVLAYALEQLEDWRPVTSPERPLSTCRDVCLYSEECTSLGTDPSIDVDPDLLATHDEEDALTGYVTHWRTTGFEKKFWRTAEEILENATHRPSTSGLSFVAEPISQSDNLRTALGHLAGSGIDVSSIWSLELRQAVDRMEQDVIPSLQPTSPEKVLAYCRDHYGIDPALTAYVDAVSIQLRNIGQLKPSELNAKTLQTKCIEARRQSEDWYVRSVDVHLRTAVQVLSMVLHAADLDGVSVDVEDFRSGYKRIGHDSSIALHSISQTPYRVRKGKPIYAIELRPSLLGKVLRFGSDIYPEDSRTESTYTLAKLYLQFLRDHPVWSEYLSQLTETEITDNDRHEVLDKVAIASLLEEVLFARRNGWKLALILTALGQTRTGFARLVNEEILAHHNVLLRRLAPYGDEGKNVISYSIRNRSNELNVIPGLSHTETLHSLCAIFQAAIVRLYDEPICVSSALPALKTAYMRTYLSGAPHPVHGAINVMLSELNCSFTVDQRTPTLITEWYGGNTGRTVYQFLVTRDYDDLLWIKVATGQEGNEGHKWKELAARARAHRLHSRFTGELWLVLDGSWSSMAIRKLYEAGYRLIFGIDEIDDLRSAIQDWLCTASAP